MGSDLSRFAFLLARISGCGRGFSEPFGRRQRQLCPSPRITPGKDLISIRQSPRDDTTRASISFTEPSSAMNSTFVHVW